MEQQSTEAKIHADYWRRNVWTMAILLLAWALVGLGGGILFADVLNEFKIPGTGLPLGFWMAHQGSILGFVAIILIYCISLNFLDRRHERQLSELDRGDDT
jgi:putative solute:sodium symporter small subunit